MGQAQQDVAQQLAVAGHLADARLDQVIEVAGHQMAFQYVRQLEHRAAELVEDVAGLGRQADFDEHQQAGLEELRIEPGVITLNEALALQPAHALGAGGGGEPDPLTELGERYASFVLQDA